MSCRSSSFGSSVSLKKYKSKSKSKSKISKNKKLKSKKKSSSKFGSHIISKRPKRSKRSKRSKKSKKISVKKFKFGKGDNSMSSLIGSYTGLSPDQATKHFNNIPDSLKSNFYI